MAKTSYSELALDGINLDLIYRLRNNLPENKNENEAIREVLLTTIKDYSKTEESIEKIEENLTSENGIFHLGDIKKSFDINFQSAFNKTLNKLGYKNPALEILENPTENNFSRINNEQIDDLMNIWNIKNERYSDADFDGGHFSGKFDDRLLDSGYVRLCVERKEDITSMIIVKKDILDSFIKDNFSKKALYEAEISEEEYLDAYYDVYVPILKNLNLDYKYYDYKNNLNMYVDGIDYILAESTKLGYTFGAKYEGEDLEEVKKLVEEHSSSVPSSSLKVK